MDTAWRGKMADTSRESMVELILGAGLAIFLLLTICAEWPMDLLRIRL